MKQKPNEGKNGIALFFMCLFLGWFGLDKLYAGEVKSWKFALTKFVLMLCVVGEIWNIYDMVCACIKRYKINPLQ